MKTSRWTATEDGWLAAKWRVGYTASEIARDLGRTRNAVLGRIYRLGLMRKAA